MTCSEVNGFTVCNVTDQESRLIKNWVNALFSVKVKCHFSFLQCSLMLLGFHTACSTDWPPRGNCLPIQEWPEKIIPIHRFTASLAIFGLTFQLNKYFWITASTFLQFCSKFSFSYKISSIFLHFSSNDYKGIVSLWYYFCSLYAGFHILRSKLRTKVLDFRAKVKAQQMMPVISKA